MSNKMSNVQQVTELINQGIIAKRNQDYKKALDFYIQAVNLIPTNGNAYYAMGKLLYIIGEPEKAKRAYYLAYINEANVFNRDLQRHFGHTICDFDEKYIHTYKDSIMGYKISIQGSMPFIDGKFYQIDISYENMCERIGKDAFKEMIRQQKKGAKLL